MYSEKRIDSTPLILGLTGGIGCGKSTVSKIFYALGSKCYNSDIEAKNILNFDTETVSEIKKTFGKDFYNSTGFNTKKMSELVFSDKSALEKLNSIVHPRVKLHFEKWVEWNKNEKLLIKEAAILIESGAYKGVDKIAVVTAPEELRIKRIISRDSLSKQEVEKRIKSQLSDEERLKYADFIISNNEKDLVIPQVLNIFNKLSIP